MRRLRALLLTPLLAAGACGDPAAADAEAAFATWLAGLPAPLAGKAFSCRYALTVDFGLQGAQSGLRAAGMLALGADGRARFDCDVEMQPPDLQGAVSPESRSIRVGSTSVFDGEMLWLEGRTDSPMLAAVAREQGGVGFDDNVITVQRATLERVLARAVAGILASAELRGAMEEAGVDGGLDASTLGPAYWVHMVGRRSQVTSFRHGGETVEVGFALDPVQLPELPGVSPELMRETAEGIALRMIFDAASGYARAVRLEFAADRGADSIAARFDLGQLSAAEPDPALFAYDKGARTAVPLDALLEGLAAQLPDPGDADEDL